MGLLSTQVNSLGPLRSNQRELTYEWKLRAHMAAADWDRALKHTSHILQRDAQSVGGRY